MTSLQLASLRACITGLAGGTLAVLCQYAYEHQDLMIYNVLDTVRLGGATLTVELVFALLGSVVCAGTLAKSVEVPAAVRHEVSVLVISVPYATVGASVSFLFLRSHLAAKLNSLPQLHPPTMMVPADLFLVGSLSLAGLLAGGFVKTRNPDRVEYSCFDQILTSGAVALLSFSMCALGLDLSFGPIP